MKRQYFYLFIVLPGIFFFMLCGCKDPYYPELKPSTSHLLVVEGFINPDGLTNIRLTRTRAISKGDTTARINETGAHVSIEDNNNNIYPLNESGDGNYSSYYFLDATNKYRLHINTSDNKEYVSDFVPCKNAPSIDSLGWKLKDGNVQMFVNTHDDSNKSIFYRWDFVQTWEYHAQYYTYLIYDPSSKQVVNRPFPVFACYRTNNSNKIFIGSSEKLSQDVIHEAPLELIPNHDKRISVLYSALITQYALDSAGYNYWKAMRSNTEEMGSIFGTQPNQTKGNIHNVADPDENVIGYVTAGSIQQKRIFIRNADLPAGWNLLPYCDEKRVTLDSLEFYFGSGALIPYSEDPPGAARPSAYFGASAPCVDCTREGGTLVKPSFWP